MISDRFQLVEKGEGAFSQLSPFLRAIYFALSISARPLHARSIVDVIKRFGLYETIRTSPTPEKTINARISEHIARNGSGSVFCRVGPAIYSLRHHEQAIDELTDYERAWHVPREKGITSENVLVAPRSHLAQILRIGFTPFGEKTYSDFENISFFMHRLDAEFDLTVKQFVTYSIVRDRERYLIYRRGKYSNPSENLSDTYSIAFGGHVTDEDFGLFTRDDRAFLDNSSRELMEELVIPERFRSIDYINDMSRISGYINVDDNSDARQHVAVVIEIDFDFGLAPQGGELGIRDVHWVSRDELKRNVRYFDLWSRYIINQMRD